MHRLTLATALLLLAGCTAGHDHAATATPSEAFANRTWQLTELPNDGAGAHVPSRPITLAIEPGTNRVSGSGGCNRYAGSADIGDGTLSFLPLISTKMACEPAIMSDEQIYLALLQQVSTYRLDGKQLILALPDGRKLAYLPTAAG